MKYLSKIHSQFFKILPLMCLSQFGYSENHIQDGSVRNISESNQPPSICQQCGNWIIGNSNFEELRGSYVSISKDFIAVPGCGIFLITEENSKSILQNNNDEEYEFIANTYPYSRGYVCNKQEGNLSLKIKVRNYNTVAMEADLIISNEKGSKFFSTDLNGAVYGNPCDSGSGNGITTCSKNYLSLLVSAISSARNEVVSRIEFKGHAEAKKSFSSEKYLSNVRLACQKKHVDPKNYNVASYGWAYGCMIPPIEKKLEEIQVWKECVYKENKDLKCAQPSEEYTE